MLTPDQKGSIAESAIVHAAIKLGLGVFKPLSDGERFDLILVAGARLIRTQCKWARKLGDTVGVNCRSARRCHNGYVHRVYTAEEVDGVAAYFLELDRCYFLPPQLFDGRPAVQLRLKPPRNNQRLGINWAKDFEFEARIREQLRLGP
jgi:hypothetical protein